MNTSFKYAYCQFFNLIYRLAFINGYLYLKYCSFGDTWRLWCWHLHVSKKNYSYPSSYYFFSVYLLHIYNFLTLFYFILVGFYVLNLFFIYNKSTAIILSKYPKFVPEQISFSQQFCVFSSSGYLANGH